MKFIFVFILLALYCVDSVVGGEFQFPGKEAGKNIKCIQFNRKNNVFSKKVPGISVKDECCVNFED